MSTSYYIYTEAKIGDKWIGIDPSIPKMNDLREDYSKPHNYDGTYKLESSETYWNGSRSYFHEAFDRLQDLGYSIPFSELSNEVKTHWSCSLAAEQRGEETYTKPIQVEFDAFKNSFNPKAYQCHGLVHKDVWFCYQSGEIEDIYTTEHEDFKRLTKEERQCFEYHEWDDSMGWNKYFKLLLEKISRRIEDFEDINGLNFGNQEIQYRIVAIRC